MNNELLFSIEEINRDILKETTFQHRIVTERTARTLEWYCKNFSDPPIKGEITKGKIKWRGLKLCSRAESNYTKHWIEQRGKIISPIIRIITKINII